ncbi:MAG: amidase [Rhodospirillales bacterium]|nr:amidase [Rhodospirillales bacterium]
MDDPSFLPAWRLAALTRTGELGCRELLDHFAARVERLNPRINAVVARDLERARARAHALDRGSRQDAPPLFGVPMTVKESFDLKGLPTTWGHKERTRHRADADALAVQRLEAAGAVVFGKTNVPVSLADWQSYNPVYGTASNPWNAAHTPGGSSGGGAAATAAGFGGLECGSDIGGSIRVPAHFCGLFGHKPSWGIASPRGHSLVDAAAFTDISVIGPLARSAKDLRLAMDGIVGLDPAETGLGFTLPAPRTTNLSELRVAVWSHEPGQATDAETAGLLEDLARHLDSEGAQVSRSARPDLDPTEAYHLYLTLLDAAMSGRATEATLAKRRAQKAALRPDDQSADAVMLRAVDLPHRDWLKLHERRHQLRRVWSAFFRHWDVLLCPVLGCPALPHMQHGETWERTITIDGHSHAYNDLLFWPGITCGFHLPATVAPLGLSRTGLPIGVQIVGPFGADHTTIAVAHMLEQSWRAFVPPPGWS